MKSLHQLFIQKTKSPQLKWRQTITFFNKLLFKTNTLTLKPIQLDHATTLTVTSYPIPSLENLNGISLLKLTICHLHTNHRYDKNIPSSPIKANNQVSDWKVHQRSTSHDQTRKKEKHSISTASLTTYWISQKKCSSVKCKNAKNAS